VDVLTSAARVDLSQRGSFKTLLKKNYQSLHRLLLHRHPKQNTDLHCISKTYRIPH
jgi:hypothetical protein